MASVGPRRIARASSQIPGVYPIFRTAQVGGRWRREGTGWRFERYTQWRHTPARHYTYSLRPYPDELPEPEYPAHFEVRWVSKIGVVNWKRKRIFVSTALAHEPLGFEHVADDLWSVFFGTLLLGRLKESEARLVPGAGR